jgi:ribosomal-protein-alanine N-acetyltransferase
MPVTGEGAGAFPAVTIREMSPSDVSAVSSILRESAAASSWPKESILESARSGIAWVAERQGNVIGFLMGRSAADEFEILNLAIAKQHRRSGVATQLLLAMIVWLQKAGTRRAYLEVRASNEAAIALYVGHGFSQNGRRVRYYQNPAEDALVFSWDIPAAG